MADAHRALRARVACSIVALGVSACGGGVQLGETVITAPSGCPRIEVHESGDVELCDHPYAHWTGSELERDGRTLFVINRDQITAGGHVVASRADDRIEVFVAEGVDDRHVRIREDGAVLNDDGQVVAKIRPAPEEGEMQELVFAALIREGIWLPKVPVKRGRRSSREVQVLGRGSGPEEPLSPCSCAQ